MLHTILMFYPFFIHTQNSPWGGFNYNFNGTKTEAWGSGSRLSLDLQATVGIRTLIYFLSGIFNLCSWNDKLCIMRQEAWICFLGLPRDSLCEFRLVFWFFCTLSSRSSSSQATSLILLSIMYLAPINQEFVQSSSKSGIILKEKQFGNIVIWWNGNQQPM